MCSEVFISQGFLGRLHPTSILPFEEVMYFLLLKIFLCLESNISIFRIEDISIFRIENISQGFLGRVHPTSILPFVEAVYFFIENIFMFKMENISIFRIENISQGFLRSVHPTVALSDTQIDSIQCLFIYR